jgi:hypothetical protein
VSPQKTNRITVLLLVLGLGSALGIFLTARPAPVDPLLEDPLNNKKYLHELRVMGGQANVLAAEFQDWFAAQWHGAPLARTVAVLTVGVTLAFRLGALHPDPAAPVKRSPSPPDPGRQPTQEE